MGGYFSGAMYCDECCSSGDNTDARWGGCEDGYEDCGQYCAMVDMMCEWDGVWTEDCDGHSFAEEGYGCNFLLEDNGLSTCPDGYTLCSSEADDDSCDFDDDCSLDYSCDAEGYDYTLGCAYEK